MVKSIIKLYFITAAASVLLIIVSILTAFFFHWGRTMAARIVGIVVGCLGGLICFGILRAFSPGTSQGYIDEVKSGEKPSREKLNEEDYFLTKHIADGKFLNIGIKFAMAIVPAILCAIFSMLSVHYFNQLESVYATEGVCSTSDLLWPVETFLTAEAAYFAFVTLAFFTRYKLCPKCFKVGTYVYDTSTDHHSSEKTQYKSSSTYGTIGDVYVNGSKVGEVKGTTGYETKSRNVRTSSCNEHYHCACCGRKQLKYHSDVFYGDWK